MKTFPFAVLLTLVMACTGAHPPRTAVDAGVLPSLFPDYADVTVPVNIAPLNFIIQERGTSFRTVVEDGAGKRHVFKGKTVSFPLREWKAMLQASEGKDLVCMVYAGRRGEMKRYKAFRWHVSPDPIDRYAVYRLIEPAYVNYGEIFIRQRDLTSFQEKDVFNNTLLAGSQERQCINCHSFQDYLTERMQLHIREEHGGTVLTDGKTARKVNFKKDGVIPNGVYPAWHPTENLMAYSVNVTNQVFLRNDPQRLEVYDSMSDLVLYDPGTDTMSYILDNPDRLETFPAWSRDGRALYYASANLADLDLQPGEEIYQRYERIKYSLYALPFDPEFRTFGEPRLLYDAAADSLSAVTPRPSPDGRFLLSAVGPYGCFQIWHDDADLYLTDLETMQTRPLQEANSPWSESFHAWSSNSRWILFASRRDNRTYSRLYIAHVDTDGHATKPFLLPQKNPRRDVSLLKSFNVPEFTMEAVRIPPKKLLKAVRQDPVQVRLVGVAADTSVAYSGRP